MVMRMGKRLPTTPRSKIRAALRQCWLRSRERQAAIKRDKYSCVKCHAKQSKAKGREVKVNVHHLDGILDWDKLLDMILASGLFVGPDGLQTLCEKCHKELDERN